MKKKEINKKGCREQPIDKCLRGTIRFNSDRRDSGTGKEVPENNR